MPGTIVVFLKNSALCLSTLFQTQCLTVSPYLIQHDCFKHISTNKNTSSMKNTWKLLLLDANVLKLFFAQTSQCQDTEIDLKRLSFSDWLASIDPSMALQQYLPCIQESYDTVSQKLGEGFRFTLAVSLLVTCLCNRTFFCFVYVFHLYTDPFVKSP